MGFRVVVITDSPSFYCQLVSAYDDEQIALIAVPNERLQSVEGLREFLGQSNASLVISALIESDPAPEHYPNFAIEAAVAYCKDVSLPLLHLSSYRVFGSEQLELDETLNPEPSTTKGQQLLEQEQTVLTSSKSLVLRLPWMLRSPGDALLERVINPLLSGEALVVSEDAAGSLVSWKEVARILVAITQQVFCGAENWGVMHVHSSDMSSEAEFADAVARLLVDEGIEHKGLSVVKGHPRLVDQQALLMGRRCTESFGIQQKSFRIGLKGAVRECLVDMGRVEA